MKNTEIIKKVLKEFPLKAEGLFQRQIREKSEEAIKKALSLKEAEILKIIDSLEAMYFGGNHLIKKEKLKQKIKGGG